MQNVINASRFETIFREEVRNYLPKVFGAREILPPAAGNVGGKRGGRRSTAKRGARAAKVAGTGIVDQIRQALVGGANDMKTLVTTTKLQANQIRGGIDFLRKKGELKKDVGRGLYVLQGLTPPAVPKVEGGKRKTSRPAANGTTAHAHN